MHMFYTPDNNPIDFKDWIIPQLNLKDFHINKNEIVSISFLFLVARTFCCFYGQTVIAHLTIFRYYWIKNNGFKKINLK